MSAFLRSYRPTQIPVDNEAFATLLLVDDEPNVLSSLKRVFRRENYHILTATSGVEALSLLAQHPVGVVLTDQRMPGMSGTELLSSIRAMHPKAIRMVLSGYTGLESLTDAINQGEIYKFITKPWKDQELIEAVREAFRRYAESLSSDTPA